MTGVQTCALPIYPEPPSHLPPHTISLGHPSAPAPSILYPASNLDWQFISYMILYMFQCHSPKSSHPLPLPQMTSFKERNCNRRNIAMVSIPSEIVKNSRNRPFRKSNFKFIKLSYFSENSFFTYTCNYSFSIIFPFILLQNTEEQ